MGDERDASEAAGHLVERVRPYEIGLSEMVVHLDRREVAAIFRKSLDQVVGVVQQDESLLPERCPLAPEGLENVVPVHRLPASVDSEGAEPAVELEAPLGHILEVFPRHLAVEPCQIDLHSLGRGQQVIVRDRVLRRDIHITASRKSQQCDD